MDYQAFVDTEKSLLVAPAGYGKTYTIVECLKYTTGKQLVLTHTHAGIAAIKEKIKKNPKLNPANIALKPSAALHRSMLRHFMLGTICQAKSLVKIITNS